jgi:hypothetical protein
MLPNVLKNADTMKTFILTVLLLHISGQGVNPCEAARSGNPKETGTALTLKEICQIERRMSRIKDGMSWEEALKKLGIWKRKQISAIAHGAMVYRSLGNDYVLANPFWSEGQSKRIILFDRDGKIVKFVEWR